VPEHDPLDPSADPFGPPSISIIVGCLHCGEEYDSYRIEWRVETDRNDRPHGFWCCPIENCDGRGFGFDIFPINKDYRDENGEKMWMDDDEEDEDCLNAETDSSSSSNSDQELHNKDDESMPW
jgi:hypothetical protein